MWVSVTGMRLKRSWHGAAFIRHALPAMGAARVAPGNLYAAARTVRGVHHTLSACWETRDAMRAFVTSGAHLAAVRAFPRIATGRTFGYETDTLPGWDEVLERWHDHGIDYAAA